MCFMFIHCGNVACLLFINLQFAVQRRRSAALTAGAEGEETDCHGRGSIDKECGQSQRERETIGAVAERVVERRRPGGASTNKRGDMIGAVAEWRGSRGCG